MTELLSDEDIFGASGPVFLSDDDIFGAPTSTVKNAPADDRSVAFGSFARGFNRLQQATNLVARETGLISDEDAAAAIARDEQDMASFPRSPDVEAGLQEISQAEGWGQSALAIITNPKAVLSVIGESIPLMAAPLAASGVGAAAGTVVAPGAGTTAGLVGGSAAGSFATEYSATMLDVLRENGVDMADEKAVAAALSDEDLISEARSRGVKRGVPIAVFDAISFGIAGRVASLFSRTGSALSRTGRVAEVGAQSALGAGGEAGAQIAADGEITSPGEVLLEGAAESVTGLPEVAIGEIRNRPEAEPAPVGAPAADAPPAVPAGAAPADVLFGGDPEAQAAPPAPVMPAPVTETAPTVVAAPEPPAARPDTDFVGADLLTEEDLASPLPNEVIGAGKAIIEDALAGKPVNAPAPGRLIGDDEVFGTPAAQTAPIAPIARRDISTDTAVTSAGRSVPVTYAVVEASTLVPSQRDEGGTNPAYPGELQPRDRERAVSQNQINQIAQKLNPRLLDKSPRASDGAPIVSEDGVVESGNGRVLALRRAYGQGMPTAEAYKAYLGEQGYPVEGMTQPVLVRVRTGEMAPADRQAFTREANERDTLGMSATERAMADAAAMSTNVLALYRGGDIDQASNRDFVRGFIREVVNPNDQAGMVDASGAMSQEATRRVQAALLGKAYGDADLVAALVESSDTNIKAIGGALMDVAADWAQMRSEAAAGNISPDVDRTDRLIEAVKLVQRARRDGRNVAEFVGQNDIFSGSSLNPVSEAFLRLMFRNDRQWISPVGRDKLADALRFYVTEARKTSAGVDLLGETAPGAEPILKVARERQYGPDTESQTGLALGRQRAAEPAREGVRPAVEGRAVGDPPAAEVGSGGQAAGDRREGVAPKSIAGEAIDGEWTSFASDSGTLNIPRSEMPQIKAEHRGALVNFLNARGVAHEQDTVAPTDLKPTQAEFSRKKVEKAKAFEGGDRSILVSSDGHVLDGHHQWLAKRESGEDVAVIRLDAPIRDLLPLAIEFPSATTSAATRAAAPATPRAVASQSPVSRIDDFGQKIEGARKDIAADFRRDLSTDVDIATEPLSKIFPQPDYRKLADAGVEPWALAVIALVRDEIPAKPRKGYKLTRWVEQVKMLRGFASDLASNRVDQKTIRPKMDAGGLRGLSDTAEVLSGIAPEMLAQASKWRVRSAGYSSFGGQRFERVKTFYTMTDDKRRMVLGPDRKPVSAETLGEFVEIAREAITAAVGAASDKDAPARRTPLAVYSDRFTKDVFIGFKGQSGVIRLKTGFTSAKDARSYITEHADELQAAIDEMRAGFNMRREVNRPREGVSRREGDVSPEQFQEAFGFRGVQFGNYVEGDRRQFELNEAFDGLMDLAEALQIPPRAISLNGTLGLAFGARGKGGANAAKAHYEPSEVVINLTKGKGAGSLAHEWFHGLDNYFGRKDAGGKGSAFASEMKRKDGAVRPEVWSAWRAVEKSLTGGTYSARLQKVDDARSKPYWNTMIEKAARGFEKYVVDRLADQKATNDYLANIDENAGAYPTKTEMAEAGITAAFDGLFRSIDSRETEAGVELFRLGDRTVTGNAELILTPGFRQQADMVADELRAALDGMGLKDVAVRVSERINALIGGQKLPAGGRYFQRAIDVALMAGDEANDPRVTVDHEAIHALRDLDLFGKAEWTILERKSKSDWMDRYGIADAYGQFPDWAQIEEGIAHAYEAWAAGERVDGIIAKSFRKIKAFLEALGNVLRGQGFTSVEDIFQDVASGEIGSRPRAGERGTGGFAIAPPVGSSAFSRWFGDSKVVDADGKPLVVYHGTNQPIEQFDMKRGGSATGANAGATKAFFFTDSEEVAQQYALHAGSRIVSNVEAFERERDRLQREVDRLEKKAQRTGKWDEYEAAMAAWETLEIDATREDETVGANTVSVYLSLQNPLVVDFEGGRLTAARDMDDMIDQAKAAGHDGLVLRGLEDSPKMGVVSDQYVAFEPTQIKSVNNRGTFDPNDPRIMYQMPSGSMFPIETVDTEDGPREQAVIPGAERVDQRTMMERRTEGRQQAKAPQKGAGSLPLFGGQQKAADGSLLAGDGRDQMSLFQSAWHGTPHSFDRFTLEKIGTGEGAQAFGWGLYFAGKREIAEFYREKLSRNRTKITKDGETVPLESFEDRIALVALKAGRPWASELSLAALERKSETISTNIGDGIINGDNMSDMVKFVGKSDWPDYEKAMWSAALKETLTYSTEQTTGKLYKVDIPDDGELLVWEKDLADHPAGIQAKVLQAFETMRRGFKPDRERSIQSIYTDLLLLAGSGSSQRNVSEALRAAGIPGHKYLDGGSRSAGDGSYNYVIYDEDAIQIVERFRLKTPPRTAAQSQQTMQGFLSRGQFIDRAIRVPFDILGGLDASGQWLPGKRVTDRIGRSGMVGTSLSGVVGAGIGTFVGGPVGTIAGAAIGGTVGGYLLGAKIDRTGRFGWMHGIAENARRGLIDRYGLDDAYVAADQRRAGNKREVMQKAQDILQVLQSASVGPQEAKVLQAVLTGETVTDADMVKLATPIRKAIDDLGAEAVSLGLISAESFERNRGSYLHRVYLKNEADEGGMSGWVQRRMNSKRKQIMGDTMKGRGMFWDVPADRLMQDVDAFKEGRRGAPMTGDRFRVLDEVSETGDMTGESKPKAIRRVYLPADEAVPDRYTGAQWRDRGEWEVRKTGKQVTLWRDYTKDERGKMGEILDARYTIARTFMSMAHDLATGRFYKEIGENENWARAGAPETGWREAADYSRYWNDPEIGWVRVPETTIADTGGKKRWGALAGKYVRAEIWRDLNELEIASKPGVWRKLLTQWKINKALALDTPIPTPTGWTTMGHIKVGDRVFDEKGEVCEVLEVKDIRHGRPCFEVGFSDGTNIVADDEHWWFVVGRNNAKGKVLTTAEIRATLREPSRGDCNHSIPVARALDLPDATLPVSSYALGLWLGDGDASKPRITAGSAVIEELTGYLADSGLYCGGICRDKRSNAVAVTIDEKPVLAGKGNSANLFKRGLRSLGVLGAKHVPPAYLRASAPQRMALLQGLMDSDGWITEQGMCGFATSSRALLQGVLELLRSLGLKPSVEEKTVLGRPAWRVHFMAYADAPIFRLSAKRSRMKARPAARQRSGTRQIVSIEPVASVPVRCISVSSASQLYLAGDGMVPTHNTARSPVVHMNNVMSNMMFMDLADVRMQDLVRGIKAFVDQNDDYKAARDGGAFGSDMISQEIRDNVLKPILEEIAKEGQGTANTFLARAGALGKVADRLWTWAKTADRKMLDAYQAEDEIFRMATFLRRRDLGDSPEAAANTAREQFLDYEIRAPWVNAARNSVFPFISYTYRAVPKIAENLAHRPWKVAKYFAIAYAVNALGYLWDDGEDGEERERASLRDEEQGYTWLGVPRMLRMPYRDQNGMPVFLDVRRWIPAGDVFDTGQGQSAVPIPAPLQFGGPLLLAFEFLLNRQAFTGDDITNDLTDDNADKAEKVGDWLWKSWMPSAIWVWNSWYWTKVQNAMTGATDSRGRDYSLPEALASSVGVKLKPQDVESGIYWHGQDFRKVQQALRAEMRSLGRQRERNLISQAEYDSSAAKITEKFARLEAKVETFNKRIEPAR